MKGFVTKAFDFCPDYAQICQYLNDTNNPDFPERDDVTCDVSPFQCNLFKLAKPAKMHTEPKKIKCKSDT